MRVAICDDDKQELLQISRLVDEYLSHDFVNEKVEVRRYGSSIKKADNER